MLAASGDNPQDVLDRCACVLDFLNEVLGEGPHGLSLGDNAAFGLCLITSEVAALIRTAARLPVHAPPWPEAGAASQHAE